MPTAYGQPVDPTGLARAGRELAAGFRVLKGMFQPRLRGHQAAICTGILLAHAVLIAAILAGNRITKAAPDDQLAIEVLLLPKPELPRVRAVAPPPRYLNLDQLNPRVPPLLTNLSSQQATAPGSTAIGIGAGVDWIAEARRAVHANDIRNEYSAYVSDKAAARDWWPEAHRAGAMYKTANGDWIVWVNSSCWFVAGADPRAVERIASTAKIACLKQDLVKTD